MTSFLDNYNLDNTTGDVVIKAIKTGMMDNNTWLVLNKKNNEGFIVDSSFSDKVISQRIKEAGVILKGILITHGHYDHIYSVEKIKNEFSSDGVRVYAGSDEKVLLSDPGLNLIKKHRLSISSVDADIYLGDGETIEIAGITVKTIFTPGHTSGGVCYYLEPENVLFSGDTLFAGSYGRTDLPTGDTETLVRSVKEKLFTLPLETKVLPGHGDDTDIGFESKNNPILDVSL